MHFVMPQKDLRCCKLHIAARVDSAKDYMKYAQSGVLRACYFSELSINSILIILNTASAALIQA